MSQKYRPDPYKFALAHDFDRKRCDDTLILCWNQGSGNNMFEEQYNKLVNEVLDICYEENSKLPFKREVRISEEIFIDFEEDQEIL